MNEFHISETNTNAFTSPYLEVVSSDRNEINKTCQQIVSTARIQENTLKTQ